MSSARGAAGEQVLDLARRRLRLGALVGALPEAQLRLAEAALEDDRVAVGVEVAVPAPRGPSSSLARLEREHLVRVVARQPLEQRPLGRRRLLQLVDHHLGEARGDPRPHVGPLDQQAVEREEDVAAVEAPRLGEDPVVGRCRARRTRARAAPSRARLRCSPPRPGARPARRGWSARPVRPSAGRSAPAGAPAARPGCRGSRAGAAAASRSGRAGPPAARPARARRRRDRARPPRRARAAAARRSRPSSRPRAPHKGRRAAPRSGRAAAAPWPAGRRSPAPARGAVPAAARSASRRASSSLLPVPAAPSTSRGPSTCAAARCRPPASPSAVGSV